MDFSEAYRYTGPSPEFSPDGQLVAIALDYRLAVRDSDSLKVVQLFTCLDKVQRLEWSSDSRYVLCVLSDRSVVQVWDVHDATWTCKVDDAPAGLEHACWVPHQRAVLTVADFGVRTAVWSLSGQARTILPGRKKCDSNLVFDGEGRRLALVERKECKDVLRIYDTATWQVAAQVLTDTADLAGVLWSPDGQCLAVWDTLLTYRILVYKPDGSCLASFSAYTDGLGIRSVSWAPSGQLLSVGSYDQVARLLNYVTWTPVLACEHPALLTASIAAAGAVIVYKEVEEVHRSDAAAARDMRSKYVICSLPVSTPCSKPVLDQANPAVGIEQQCWSNDGSYLVTINANMPSTAWIWSLANMQLAAVLMHACPIKGVAWAPGPSASLALCTSTSRVYFWSPAGASIVHIPLENFKAGGIKWHSSGKSFMLQDHDTMCCAYTV